jgi:nucleoside transporter
VSPLTYSRLGVMMFLEYAVLGAWSPVLAVYLRKQLGFTGAETGRIFSLLWLGCIVSPFLGGQIADRWVPGQWLLAGFHLAGGLCLIMAARATGYVSLWPWMLLYALAFAPTLALSNSVALKHLTNTTRQFGSVRVFGTIGWIAAGVALTAWRRGSLGLRPWPNQADCLLLAAGADLALAVWCLLLPPSPPSRTGESPWAFLKALRMARDPRFRTFLILSFVISTQLHFYYMLGSRYLNDMGLSAADLPRTMALAQTMEILVMAVGLPLALHRLGFRVTLAIGAAAWPVRFVIWALAAWLAWPVWVPVAALVIHGFCSVFWLVASTVYVDAIAPRDVRHSAQAFLTLSTLGVGYYISTHIAGFVEDLFTSPKLDAAGRAILDAVGRPATTTQWHLVLLVPIIVTGLCALAYALAIREIKPGELAGAEVEETPAPIG